MDGSLSLLYSIKEDAKWFLLKKNYFRRLTLFGNLISSSVGCNDNSIELEDAQMDILTDQWHKS